MEYIKINLNHPSIIGALSNATQWKKKALVTMRVAKKDENLTTKLADGTIETSRVLNGGEIIVTNPMGEEYAIDEEKFHKLYEPSSTEGIWSAKGIIRALPNPMNKPIEIMAPWGEPQYGQDNCFIVQGDGEDRYIVGRDEFYETYQLHK